MQMTLSIFTTATNRQSRSSRLSIRFSNLTVYSFMIRLESIACYFLFHPITRLQQYDDQHHANLIETLQSIINCGWNLKLASEKLFLHYNSVKYRFQKICDLLEIDLRDNSRHTEIELALKIYLIQKNQIQRGIFRLTHSIAGFRLINKQKNTGKNASTLP